MLPRSLHRWVVLLCTLAGLTILPGFAQAAKKKAAPPPPEISLFEMDPVSQLAPGAELFFRVQGSPNSRATVRVSGVRRTIVLQEVDDGVYEGSYSLHSADRVTAGSSATASLRRNGRSSTSTMGHLAAAAPPVQPAQAPKPPQPLAINKFNAMPIDRFEPGTEMRLQLEGTPGGHASFSVPEVAANVPMREVAPGRYEGAYTIKRGDRMPAGVEVVATLEANGQAVKSTLGRASLLADTRPPSVRNLFPRDGATVPAGNVAVSGTFDDHGGLGVDPKTVKLVVGGRDVTAQASIAPQYFTYRTDLQPGSYAVEVTARDNAGNPVRNAWSFVVGAAPGPLALEIKTPHQNAVVPRGPAVQIQGRTAPNATVTVDATGYANVAGAIGISQPLYKGTTTADANGDFSVTYTPPFNAPGLREEIDIKAEQGGRTREERVVVFEQR